MLRRNTIKPGTAPAASRGILQLSTPHVAPLQAGIAPLRAIHFPGQTRAFRTPATAARG
jgi:hypothetical protein